MSECCEYCTFVIVFVMYLNLCAAVFLSHADILHCSFLFVNNCDTTATVRTVMIIRDNLLIYAACF